MDAVLVEVGTEEQETIRGGAALQWQWSRQWFNERAWHLGGAWEASLSYWNDDEGRSGTGSLAEVGFTPVLQLTRHSAFGGIIPYFEGGVGVHLRSETEIGDRHFDLPFAFGLLGGAGLLMGPQGQYQLGYRFEHQSNADLGDTNPGMDFHLLRLGYHF
ncbi:MAG: acyloxyacyl hydrolase [Chromatiales bacterium]